MNPSADWPIIIGIGALFGIALLVLILRQLAVLSGRRREDQSIVLLQQQVESLRGQFSTSLERGFGQVTRSMDERLKAVGEVQARLGSLEEASRRLMEIGKDIASLQNILRSPKVRGGIGEFFLEKLLSQMLPRDHFRLQHPFKRGEKVDACIIVGDRLVPVDAKFPLDNFRRLAAAQTDEERKAARKAFLTDVRKHVDAIAAKYIVPEEGTYDFAMMYIPAENVYYETIITGDESTSLQEYSLDRKVIPVSPGSFYAYLQVIILGLKGMHVEESAREILARLSGLGVEMEKHQDDFRKLGVHLKNALGSFDSAEKRLDRMALELEKLETPRTPPLESSLEIPGRDNDHGGTSS